MTTHDQPAMQADDAAGSAAQTPTMPDSGADGAHDRTAPAPPSSAGAESGTETTESSGEGSLLAHDRLAMFRDRWNDVQTGFVDDPRACVEKADGLVSGVVDELTAGFAAARARLEEQWTRGEEASTEDLRVALQRYRQFFQRLLEI